MICPETGERAEVEYCASFGTGAGLKGCKKKEECWKAFNIDWEFQQKKLKDSKIAGGKIKWIKKKQY